MYAELYRYLLLNKELPLPGVGTFRLERTPATGDFLNRQFMAPSYAISMQASAGQPSARFFKWLGSSLSVSDRDAIIRFNDFVFELKKQISDGGTVEWKGVGMLNKGLAGGIKFSPADSMVTEAPVNVEKVIRQKAEHTVRVGEDEKTAAEMEEILGSAVSKRSYWWVIPLIIGIIAIVIIIWIVLMREFEPSVVGNKNKLMPI